MLKLVCMYVFLFYISILCKATNKLQGNKMKSSFLSMLDTTQAFYTKF